MGRRIKIEIKNRWTGSVIFEYESEDNTIKKTVEEAVKRSADLWGANLSNSDLSGANLSNSNLWGANLSNSDLSGANLSGANLSGANLSGADLSNSDLWGANLWGANLSGADLRSVYIRGLLQLLSGNSIFRICDIGSRMGTTYAYNTDKGIYVQCGCFFGTLDEFAAKVEQTHGDNQHGKVYKAIIEVIKLRFAEE